MLWSHSNVFSSQHVSVFLSGNRVLIITADIYWTVTARHGTKDVNLVYRLSFSKLPHEVHALGFSFCRGGHWGTARWGRGRGGWVCIKQSDTWTPTAPGAFPTNPDCQALVEQLAEPGIQWEEVMERSKPEGHLGFCQATRKHPSHLYRACEGLWQQRASAGSPVLGCVDRAIRWATMAPHAGAGHGIWSQPDSVVLGELRQNFI